MEYTIALIGEARDRQRWRRRRLAAAVLAAAALALAVYLSGMFRSGPAVTSPIRQPSGTVAQTPARTFSQAPYMGVAACPRANSIACERVGLAVWLKQPAHSVRATIDGRSFQMSRFGNPPRPGTEFAGYLEHAGIMSRIRGHAHTWLGNPTPSATVWVLVGYRGGRHVVTHLRVPLMAGWG